MIRRDLIFRVFVSSTFGDLIAERNALQKKTFPELRKYCQQRGARFQAIDLRWGVSQEAALDQQTMNICFQELHRCQELSPKPNFILLLGQRYGWRPLPPQILADEFEEILSAVQDPEDRALLVCQNDEIDRQRRQWQPGTDPGGARQGWYRKDLNAVPHEYVLLPRTVNALGNATPEDLEPVRKAEEDDWNTLEQGIRRIILDAIDRLGWAGDDPRRAKYVRSATHQEIDHGAFQAQNPQEHVFGYFRDIADAPSDGSVAAFVDSDPTDINNLRADIEKLVPGNTRLYTVGSDTDRPPYDLRSTTGGADAQHDDLPFELTDNPYLAALCRQVFFDLRAVIDREIESFQRETGLQREERTHREFAEDRAVHFVGREDVLRQIYDYVRLDNTAPLVIHSPSGLGKTALMAKAWLDLPQDTRSVARFIGATPGSSDLRALLTDLYGALGLEEVPSDMNELVRAFRGRLSASEESETEPKQREPVVLFLDALDQFNLTDNARMLYWLPRELAPGVKLVMSVLETDPEEENDDGRDDPFDLARRIWPESLVALGRLGNEEGKVLLGDWLAAAGRTLQEDQRRDVLDNFNQCGNPLYLKLAFEEARRWKSWEGLPCGSDDVPGLNDDVTGILEDLFWRLEQDQHHGHTLVSRALGYIGTGKNGLTEDELLDVLSADKDVMKDFFRRSPESPLVDRLPVVVWSRLFADVQPYMTRRRADGTIVLDFYHRQVGRAVAQRYLQQDDLLRAHLHLAEYFHGLDYWAESLEAQRARARLLPPTPRPANVRKVVELPYHRLEVAKMAGKDDPKSPHWDTVADLLTDWEFLEAKAEADPNFQEQETLAKVSPREESPA